MALTVAEEIKKRCQEYIEELYEKDLNDLDNHDGVVTHLEPDILECDIKWPLRSITMNKASGSDEIPNELFNFIKDDDCLSATQNMSANLENSAVSHRTGKGQFSFQSQRMFKLPYNCAHLTC